VKRETGRCGRTSPTVKRERDRKRGTLPNSETGKWERLEHCPTVKRVERREAGVLPNSETGRREDSAQQVSLSPNKEERTLRNRPPFLPKEWETLCATGFPLSLMYTFLYVHPVVYTPIVHHMYTRGIHTLRYTSLLASLGVCKVVYLPTSLPGCV